MKPRVTYPRTVVLPKDCEQLWLLTKRAYPTQSFNGWIVASIRNQHSDALANILIDNSPDEA